MIPDRTMAIYAIGDLQGCLTPLQRLLDKLNFDPAGDQLWFAGDLVNRGPDSLGTMRFVKSLGAGAITVLGNHDLHLFAVAVDHKSTSDNGLQTLLAADDAPQLLDWLRHQPLIHSDEQLGYTLVHAGIYPFWNLQQAHQYAEELHSVLCSDGYLDFIHNMYGNKPARWDESLQGWDRLRFICNCFTRMRYCHHDGKLNLKDNGAPGSQTEDGVAWFDLPQRQPIPTQVLFGHWSTLGKIQRNNVYALDTGCVWGGELTALRLDSEQPRYVSIACEASADPVAFMKKN